MSPDVPASVKACLLHRARRAGEDFELVLVRYGCERFLWRLGMSPWKEHCVLKGAGLFSLWLRDPYRATRDLDFLAFGAATEERVRERVRELVRDVCLVPCPEDGLVFDLHSIQVMPIRAEEEYAGQRVVLRASLGAPGSASRWISDSATPWCPHPRRRSTRPSWLAWRRPGSGCTRGRRALRRSSRPWSTSAAATVA